MSITELKAKKVMAGPGVFVYIAEAKVDDEGHEVYVTVQYYDGEEYSVAEQSVYGFFDGDGEGPVAELLEEYDSLEAASGSGYAKVFEMLCDMIDGLW